MASDLRELLDFLDEQRRRQAPHFPTVQYDKVLSYVATTSRPGTYAAAAVLPLVSIAPSGGSRELRVTLRGSPPRAPERGECLTVHLTNVGQYQGYQIKTRALASADQVGDLFQASGPDLVVHGAQTFTVHHSPYTMKFFEQIPFEEVQETVGALPYAIVAVGEQANVSPRFVFHSEARQGRPVLFHGDGLALKTYMNLRSNRQVTRLVLDLDDSSGWLLRGTIEEFQPHQHPQAYERICGGFAAGNWGKPTRAFKFTAETWERIAPAAPAVKRKAAG